MLSFILLVLIVIALGVGAYSVYRNTKAVRAEVNAAATKVETAISKSLGGDTTDVH